MHFCVRPEFQVGFELSNSLVIKIDHLNIQIRFKLKHFGQIQIVFEKIAQEPIVFGRKQAKQLSHIVNEIQAQMY